MGSWLYCLYRYLQYAACFGPTCAIIRQGSLCLISNIVARKTCSVAVLVKTLKTTMNNSALTYSIAVQYIIFCIHTTDPNT